MAASGWVSFVSLTATNKHATLLSYHAQTIANKVKKLPRFSVKTLRVHLTNKCPRRTFQCPHCHENGEYEERTGEHLKTCPQVITECPNDGCTVKFPRVFILGHDAIRCEYKPVPCRYAKIGCEERPQRKDLKKHEEDAQLHLQVTTETVLKLTSKADQLTIKAEQLENEVKQLQNKTEELEIEHKKMQNESKFTFQVPSFDEKKKYKTILYSAPFYSGRKGYKLCIRVDANGCGRGKGTHVSVFACLMKGDNDNSLTWPFTGTVTFELLNQLEDKNHHKQISTFQAESIISKRVVDRERAVHGYGRPQFIPHTDLNYKPDINCQYLKDDTLVFRVSAEAPDYKPWLECTD